MTTAEKIEVMQAYLDGKQIQIKVGDGWKDIYYEPEWDWGIHDYRIKPEAKVRPYTFDELVEAIKVHGVMVRSAINKSLWTILFADEDEIKMKDGVEESYEEFLEYNVWLDGSPCGVAEE